MNTTFVRRNTPHSHLFLTLPAHLWRHVLTFYGYKDHTLAGLACQYLHALWTEAVGKGKLPLFVPVDCNTLREAVDRVHGDDRLTTIVVGKGKHQIDGEQSVSYTHLTLPTNREV